jgi:hypothetical protein
MMIQATKLILLRENVEYRDIITDSLLDDVHHVVMEYEDKWYPKIGNYDFTALTHLAFMYHNESMFPYFKDPTTEGAYSFSYMNFGFIMLLKYILRARKESGRHYDEPLYIDLITCNVVDEDVKRELSSISTDFGVIIRYSFDATGWEHYRGNWILESHNVDLKELYFTNNILTWTSKLDTIAYDESYFINNGPHFRLVYEPDGTTDGSGAVERIYINHDISGNPLPNEDYDASLNNIQYPSSTVIANPDSNTSRREVTDDAIFGHSQTISVNSQNYLRFNPFNSSNYDYDYTYITTLNNIVAIHAIYSEITYDSVTAVQTSSGTVKFLSNANQYYSNIFYAWKSLEWQNVKYVFKNKYSFVGVRTDGKVYSAYYDKTDGNIIDLISNKEFAQDYSGNGPNNVRIATVTANQEGFAALDVDGNVHVWQIPSTTTTNYGGIQDEADESINGAKITTIYSSNSSFAALDISGGVHVWGNPSTGGSTSNTFIANNDIIPSVDDFIESYGFTDINVPVVRIYSNGYAFAALDISGGVHVWGNAVSGGSRVNFNSEIYNNISKWYGIPVSYKGLPSNLPPIVAIYPSPTGFAASDSEGNIHYWGYVGSNTSISDTSIKIKYAIGFLYGFLGITFDNKVYVFGVNAFSRNDSIIEDFENIYMIRQYDMYNYFLDNYGNVYKLYSGWSATSGNMIISQVDISNVIHITQHIGFFVQNDGDVDFGLVSSGSGTGTGTGTGGGGGDAGTGGGGEDVISVYDRTDISYVASTSGDPHIYAMDGSIYEMGKELQTYRLLQGTELFLNASVRALTSTESQAIRDYYMEHIGLSYVPTRLVTDGVFYNTVYFYSDGKYFLYNFDFDSYGTSDTDGTYFTYQIVPELVSYKGSTLIKYAERIVSFTHSVYGDISISLREFNHPQIKYGFDVSINTILGNDSNSNVNVTGPLVEEYNLSLCTVNSITNSNQKQLVKGSNPRYSTSSLGFS